MVLTQHLPALSVPEDSGNPSGGRDSLERILSLFPLQPEPQDVPACLSSSSHSQRGNSFQVARAFSARLDGHWAGSRLLGSFLEPPQLGKLEGWRHFPREAGIVFIPLLFETSGLSFSAFGSILTEPQYCLIWLCDLLPLSKSKLLTGPSPCPASTNESLMLW